MSVPSISMPRDLERRGCARALRPCTSLEDLAGDGELFLVIVSTDDQSRAVTEALSRHANDKVR